MSVNILGVNVGSTPLYSHTLTIDATSIISSGTWGGYFTCEVITNSSGSFTTDTNFRNSGAWDVPGSGVMRNGTNVSITTLYHLLKVSHAAGASTLSVSCHNGASSGFKLFSNFPCNQTSSSNRFRIEADNIRKLS